MLFVTYPASLLHHQSQAVLSDSMHCTRGLLPRGRRRWVAAICRPLVETCVFMWSYFSTGKSPLVNKKCSSRCVIGGRANATETPSVKNVISETCSSAAIRNSKNRSQVMLEKPAQEGCFWAKVRRFRATVWIVVGEAGGGWEKNSPLRWGELQSLVQRRTTSKSFDCAALSRVDKDGNLERGRQQLFILSR